MTGKVTNSKSHSGKINVAPSLGSKISSGGVTDHNRLFNRDMADQHPIESITDLRKELDSKLDSETALPIINETVKGKVKGLYFDAKKELNRKAYWYLTSEIDSKTGQGTKDSIISGPYDLGMGGGSGGGGGYTTVKISKIDWPVATILRDDFSISVDWSSVVGDQKEPTGEGSLYLSINGQQVDVKPSCTQGRVTFENVKLSIGNNAVEVKVIDAYGTTGIVRGTITAASLVISDNKVFNDGLAYQDTVNYRYQTTGDYTKTVYFIVDGKEYGHKTIASYGDTVEEYLISGLQHGAHTLEVFFTAEVGGQTQPSNRLYHELIIYQPNNSTPIITSSFEKETVQEQYLSFTIPYYIYNTALLTPRVYYFVEYQGVRTEIEAFAEGFLANRELQKLTYKFDECHLDGDGNVIEELNKYTIIIKSGNIEKKFIINVTKSTVNVVPITTALALHLDAQGRSNKEPEEKRVHWIDNVSKLDCELINFNWASNGWLTDDNTNESFLRLNAGARAIVPTYLMSGTPQLGGKTIELDFKASEIRDYETPLLTCRNSATQKFYEVSATFVDFDIRAKDFTITLDQDLFASKYTNVGTYIFEYSAGDIWKDLNGDIIDLESCGIVLKEHTANSDGEYPDQWKLIGDVIVIAVVEDAIGFYVTPQKAAIRSLQSKLSTQFKEDEHVRISIVIEDASIMSPTHILWMYVNGIAACAIQYPLQGENFAHENFMYIGADNATIDIYNIRVYNQALTHKQVIENWIADTQDPALRVSRNKKNAIYDSSSGRITPKSIEALGNLPYIVWDVDNLPTFKGDKKLGNVVYWDPSGPARSFKAGDATYNVQGTSSAGYPTKNIRTKYKQAKADEFPNCEFWWEDGYEDSDGTEISKFAVTVDGIGDNYFTYKVDYASSEGANNVELTKLYNDVSKELGILTPPQRKNPKVRIGIDGFPIVAFHEDASGNRTFCTKANFNNDKDNEKVYGFEAGDESWEITNNSFRTTKFKAGVDITDKTSSDYYSKGFEARFPEDNSDLNKLKAMTDWVASTDPEQATNTPLSELLGVESVTFTYNDKELGEDNSYKDVTKTETFTQDNREYRLTKFKSELKDWFNVESTLLYYLFTELFLMIDSRAKNAFPTYFKSRQEGDGGNRWFWIPYDMDTALGINNMGELVFDYSLEDYGEFGRYAGGKVYNGQESVMWNNVREGLYGQLSAMYARMRSSLINFIEIDRRFDEHQNKWPEAIFNEDAIIKYVNPLKPKSEGGLGENYLSMLQGNKAQQRKWWLYNRIKYIDSKYTAADAKSDYIQFRAYAGGEGIEKPSITVIPYTDIYAAASYSNGIITTARAQRNIPTVIPTPFATDDDSNEQETYIYSASQLKDIGDLSPFYAKTVKVAAATKLQALKVGDNSPDYKNENLRQLELGENTLLKTLDVRNCINLGKNDESNATPEINISGCTNIEEIYFTGTQITGIQLPNGGNIKTLCLPGTLGSLIIRNQPVIETLQIDRMLDTKTNKDYLALELLWLENIPFDKINAKEMLELMLNKPTDLISASFSQEFNKYQRGVSLHGINEQFDTLDDLKTFINLLDNFFGVKIVNQLIVADLSSRATVSGNVTVNEIIPYSTLLEICDWDVEEQAWRLKAYKDVFVYAPNTTCKVIFDFANGEELLTLTIDQYEQLQNPKIPTKPSIQSHYYTFSHWLDEDGNIWSGEVPISIAKDIRFTAEYTSALREYTITFNSNSNIIPVTPTSITVKYGSTISKPTILDTNIPDGVQFIGWFDSKGNPWIFKDEFEDIPATLVEKDETLIARWEDFNKPNLEIYRVNYNTFRYSATDNLGITSWRLIDENGSDTNKYLPEVETQITGTIEITTAGRYSFEIKDTGGNVETANIVAYPIKINATPDLNVWDLKFIEGETEIITDFALSGTTLNLVASVNSHYKNVSIDINTSFGDNLNTFIVDKDVEINLSCTPKNYSVVFDLVGKGDFTKAPTQIITYLHKVEKPAEQYYFETHEVIEGWYLNKNYVEDSKWDFENNIIEGNTTLYAKWVQYNDPTKLTIRVPAGDQIVNILYSQYGGDPVRIDWGDGEPISTSDDYLNVIRMPHIYKNGDSEKEYIISIYGPTSPNASYSLGGGYITDAQVIVPISYLTKVEFSYDLVGAASGIADIRENTLKSYAFISSEIDQVNFTPYMTSISSACFANCKNLTSLNIPSNITKISSSAFEGCLGLTTIALTDHLSAVGSNAFSYCENLISVDLLTTEECTYGSEVFKNCSNLKSINFGPKFTTISNNMFAGCIGLQTLEIPEQVKNIGASAFMDCQGLIEMSTYAKYINNSAFKYCTKLEHVKLFNDRLNLDLESGIVPGTEIFDRCSKLNSAGPLGSGADIEFAWTIEIPAYAFSRGFYMGIPGVENSSAKNSLNEVKLPKSLRVIGKSAFSNSFFSSIELPNNLEFIGELAFDGAHLTQIEIPHSVISIGAKAFAKNNFLTKATIKALSSSPTVDVAENAWFYDCTAGLKILIPASVNTSVENVYIAYGEYWHYRTSSGEIFGWSSIEEE